MREVNCQPIDLLHQGVQRVIGVYLLGTDDGPALFDSSGQAGVRRGDEAADRVFRSLSGLAGRGAQRAATGATRGKGAYRNEKGPLPCPGHYRPPRGSQTKGRF